MKLDAVRVKADTSRHNVLWRPELIAKLGSYGGLPILSVSVSPDESDDQHVINVSRRGKKKGKSRLANAHSRTSLNRSDDDLIMSEPIPTSRRRRDERRSSQTLNEELEGHEETRFEARFNASSMDPSIAGASSLLDSSRSSSSSTDPDEAETSDDDDLHDVKGNPLDNSPYAQVRASVAATDDVSLSIDTPRMWFLSILFAIAGSSTNLFFSLRYPSVSLTPIIALLLVHPLGLFWDQIFKRHDDPEQVFVNGYLQKTSHTSQTSHGKASLRRRFRLWLAQGSWNAKEHCCVYVSSNVSFGFAFATDVGVMSPVHLVRD